MNKTLRVLEMLWLVFGLVCIVYAAYVINQKGLDNTESKMLLFGAFLAGAFYALRRRQRIKAEEADKRNKPEN